MKMTDEEIDKMEAGREMDALIAEHLFDWVWLVDKGDYMPSRDKQYPNRFLAEPEIFSNVSWRWDNKTEMLIDNSRICCRSYSTKAGAAWRVVEKIRELRLSKQFVTLWGQDVAWHWAFLTKEAFCLHVCRAALKCCKNVTNKKEA